MTQEAAEAPESAHDEAAHEAAHAHPSYVKIWIALLVLLAISVAGPMLEIPVVTLITAFGIAIVKAYLVIRYFMHVNVEPKIVGYLLASMLAFVALFYAGVAPDVQLHEGQQWVNVAAREHVERALAATGPGTGPVETGPFDAAQEFQTTCGVCHGAGGAGDGPAAAALDPHPANFTDAAFWATRDREHVARVIDEGGAAVGRSALMPAFGSRYDPEQLVALVDHVLGLAPEGAVQGEQPPDGGAGDAGAEAVDAGTAAPSEAP